MEGTKMNLDTVDRAIETANKRYLAAMDELDRSIFFALHSIAAAFESELRVKPRTRRATRKTKATPARGKGSKKDRTTRRIGRLK